MKKSLVALAAFSLVGAASAQSSVTLFGTVDVTMQRIVNNGGGSVWRMHNSGLTSSKLGFRGAEDLGGGMSAKFWLEAALNNDTGTGGGTNTNNQASGAALATAGGQGLTFNRSSWMSLASSWGELRLGRDYTPQFLSQAYYDPFGTVGVGANQITLSANPVLGATPVRASNSIGYILPSTLGGFYGQAMYYLGENASNVGATSDDGDGYGMRLGYTSGPFDGAISVSRTKYAAGNPKSASIGGQWSFGVVRVMGMLEKDTTPLIDARGWLIGAASAMGPVELKVSYAHYKIQPLVGPAPTVAKLSLGAIYNLSKRTALYTTVARLRNTNGSNATVFGGAAGLPGVNQGSSGLDLGFRHNF